MLSKPHVTFLIGLMMSLPDRSQPLIMWMSDGGGWCTVSLSWYSCCGILWRWYGWSGWPRTSPSIINVGWHWSWATPVQFHITVSCNVVFSIQLFFWNTKFRTFITLKFIQSNFKCKLPNMMLWNMETWNMFVKCYVPNNMFGPTKYKKGKGA